ncbi:shikimate dehydrogenase [Corynebacterium mendelii]|uniref:shikimate dehydrogenase n=1 Tax=Corynebacterium mendelii TaxID=2765362 RepID=UPI002ED0BFEB
MNTPLAPAHPSIARRAAVIGHPVDHSLSPVLHTAGYTALGLDDFSYGRIDCDADGVAPLLAGQGRSYAGFSCTMPCKFAALAVADHATHRATSIGSANTLVQVEPGVWRADNTDCDGVAGALDELGVARDLSGARALVVGAGGTARPAVWALGGRGVDHIDIVNRSDRSDQFRDLARACGVSVSFHPTEHADLDTLVAASAVVVSTVPSAAIVGLEHRLAKVPVVDVIYNPWPTALVSAARANGVAAVGGHVMLACQAYSQFEQFTGHPAPTQAMRASLEAYL